MTPEDTARAAEAGAEASALAELTLCENLAQISGWAARWSAASAEADAALLWAPDALHPMFLCIAAVGEGTEKTLRRSVPRETGLAHDLVRDREPIFLSKVDLLTTADPLLKGIPTWTEAVLVVPLHAENVIVGILALLYRHAPDAGEALEHVSGFSEYAAPALGRALRSERKTIGMLHAIERLTNLYDLSKAFGSTIDLAELCAMIVRKAADFMTAEVASLWVLEGDEGEVSLAATAVNENYVVEPEPAAVGSAVVADVIVNQENVRKSRLEEDDPLRTADDPYVTKSILAVPFVEDGAPVGALVVTNKRGRNPEFTPADEELLTDLARQAVRALHNARQYEAEKKVAELDALLAVSREITSTLDLDRVMKTIVNASAALVSYDRCAIAIVQRGRPKLGAVSGMDEVNRDDASVQKLGELLEWLFYGGSDIAITRNEDGSLVSDRPETEEKFKAFFDATGMSSFYGVLLKDEEGKLGVLSYESQEPIVFEQNTRDMLQILVNQATVAVRNAQLYQQVPLPGFLKPLVEGRRKLGEMGAKKGLAYGIGAAVVLLLLFLVPWRVRVAAPARVLPVRQTSVASPFDGFVDEVLHREGDRVEAGAVIATMRDERLRSELAEARSEVSIRESELARARMENDSSAMAQAQARRDEARARLELAEQRLEWTQLKAPVGGVIVTPRLEEKAGASIAGGDVLCVLADTSTVSVEIAVPESEVSELKTGQPIQLKMNPYPTRTFRGSVTRVGVAIHEEGENRFVIAESQVENADGLLRTGMLGKGKVTLGTRSLAVALLRRPVRAIALRIWPLLP